MRAEYLPKLIGIGVIVGVVMTLVGIALRSIMNLPSDTPFFIGATGAVAGVIGASWLARQRNPR